jgi:hypothetical protein
MSKDPWPINLMSLTTIAQRQCIQLFLISITDDSSKKLFVCHQNKNILTQFCAPQRVKLFSVVLLYSAFYIS